MDIECTKEQVNIIFEKNFNFEEILDSVDFNSYLPRDKRSRFISETCQYHAYIKNINAAEKIIFDSLQLVPASFCNKFFNAKKWRLDARKQSDRKKEKQCWTKAVKLLNDVLSKIVSSDSKVDKGNLHGNIYDENTWAKILLYNELSICYSGLPESSISLGYAERAIGLLKKILPDSREPTQSTPLQIKQLYTVSLYNRGEAEKLLHDNQKAIDSYNDILRIYSESKEKPSDYYSALIRKSMILIDMGRGKEALDLLRSLEITKDLDDNDYRKQDCVLEKVRALLDMKEYNSEEEGYRVLPVLRSYLSRDWKNTFAERKASVYILSLVTEFIDNHAKDFSSVEKDSFTQEMDKINKRYTKMAERLLKKCLRRYDSDNFKKVCVRLSEYYNRKKKSATPEIEHSIRLNELRYYYLYLFSEVIFEDGASKSALDDWSKKDLREIVDRYEKDHPSTEFINKIDDENYLLRFFRCYLEIDKNDLKQYPANKLETILELKDHLIRLLPEKGNSIEAQKIQEEYEIFQDRSIAPKDETSQKHLASIKFINDSFLKEEISSSCLNPRSMLKKMNENTLAFAEEIVYSTKRFSANSQTSGLKGILLVLRRWNSFTPALTSSVNHSKGGGYFFYFSCGDKNVGIVIDPGYDFRENLFSFGFRIGDINVVAVSHAHPDHTDSLPSILPYFMKPTADLENIVEPTNSIRNSSN